MIETLTLPDGPVPLAQAEAALRRLYASVETDGGQHGMDVHPSVTRAIAQNLLIYAPGERCEAATEIARELAEAHPGRTVVLDVGAASDPHQAVATAAIHCGPPDADGHRICSEQLTLHLAGDVVNHLDKVVLPLLVPDLRTLLWWTVGVPFEAPFFARLGRLCDQMIVDGSSYDEAERFLLDLARHLGDAQGTRPEVRGLAWARLTRWRRLIAQFFDGERHRPALDRLDRVTIRHHGADRNPDRVEPLLLLGWLASRLDWQPTGTVPDGFTFTAPDGQTVTTEIVQVSEAEQPPTFGIVAVELGAGSERTFCVERWCDDDCLRTSVSGVGIPTVERVTPAHPRSTVALIGEELEILPRDVGLEAAIAILPTMLGEATR